MHGGTAVSQSRGALSPLAPVLALTNNWPLVRQMTLREVVGRYRGSILGVLWSFFNPLLLLTVYTFLFGHVFKSKWGLPNEGTAEFAVMLFVGMIVHSLLAECANRAPALVVNNANYVRKIVFPLETLAWVVVGTALFHALVSIVVLLLAQVVLMGVLPLTVLMLPVVLVSFLPVVVGTVWLLASIGVFVRDMQQAVVIFTLALLFLAPVFYPSSMLSEQYRWILSVNPLTLVIEQSRDVLIWGRLPDFLSLTLYFAAGCIYAWLALWWFQKTRPGFADVL
jgi:lipopolysaccharide transport system permease protein